jgi:CubicO group peptidase (beta-lactamase class C family)
MLLLYFVLALYVACSDVSEVYGQSKYQTTHHTAQKTQRSTPASTIDFTRLAAFMDSCIQAHVFPSAVVAVMKDGKLVHHHAYGRFTYESAATAATLSTLYDMASLTKVICTTTCLMKLVGDGTVGLDEKVSRYLPTFATGGKQDVTVRNLLLHNAGFAPFRPVPKEYTRTEEFMDYILRDTLKYRTGDSTVYSDIGFITLGELVRAVTGKRLDVYFAENFTKPMGLQSMMFNPPASVLKRVAPVEPDSNWVWKKPRALVHDPRAAFTDGVSGHAGLFSTAEDAMELMRMLTSGGMYKGRRYLKAEVIQAWTRRASETAEKKSSRGIGWDTRVEGERSSAGTLFSTSSFGHTGFTGTSIWADPTRSLVVVLLTNRVYPSSENRKIIQVRPLFHNLIVEIMGK